jgi:predicted P-loop ATPase
MAVECPAWTGWQVGHDQFRDEIMVTRHEQRGWRPFRDTDYTELRRCLVRAFPGGGPSAPGMKPVGRETMRDAVDYVAEKNSFDSARLWLTEEVPDWDGTPRADRFLVDYFDAEDSAYARAVGRYIWTALAGRVLSPGCKADMMPVLVGPQGVMKSSAVAAMVPGEEHYFEVDLRAPEDDLARRMRGRLVGEVDELRGLQTREIEAIKSFITRTHERWVPKYREFAVSFPRRCLLIGTTNDQEFLADETGNRRFLPVTVTQASPDAIDADRGQLWAEARELWRQHGVQYREAERLAAEVHDAYRIRDSWEELVGDWLDFLMDGDPPDQRNRDQLFTLPDVIRGALRKDPAAITPSEERRLGRVLRGLGFERRRRRVAGQLTSVWVEGD